MSDIEMPSLPLCPRGCASICVPLGHKYCTKLTELRKVCICQRWIRVCYTGSLLLTPEEWKQLMAEKLQGIECEYFGYELTKSVDRKGVEPLWVFLVYLYKPILRDEVVRRFSCDSIVNISGFFEENENGNSDRDMDGYELDVNEGLFPEYSCCTVNFLGSVRPFFQDGKFLFASNEAFLRATLGDEFAFYCQYELEQDGEFPRVHLEKHRRLFNLPSSACC